jgi:hypothetical protein
MAKTAVRGSVGVFNQTRVSANAIWTDVARNPPIVDRPRIFYGTMDTLLCFGWHAFPKQRDGLQPLTRRRP